MQNKVVLGWTYIFEEPAPWRENYVFGPTLVTLSRVETEIGGGYWIEQHRPNGEASFVAYWDKHLPRYSLEDILSMYPEAIWTQGKPTDPLWCKVINNGPERNNQ